MYFLNFFVIYLYYWLIFCLAYKGDLMMDFFLDNFPHDGFNQGKKIAIDKSQEAKTLDVEDTIEKIFVKINSHLTPEVAKGTNACFLFVVKGNSVLHICNKLNHVNIKLLQCTIWFNILEFSL